MEENANTPRNNAAASREEEQQRKADAGKRRLGSVLVFCGWITGSCELVFLSGHHGIMPRYAFICAQTFSLICMYLGVRIHTAKHISRK